MAWSALRTTTFLVTDIEASTRLWDRDREAMSVAVAAHDVVLRAAVERNGGTVVKTTGDGLLATFEAPQRALRCALQGQSELDGIAAPGGVRLRVRMAIHTGTAEERDGDFFGPTLNRVARLLAIGHGGQVLVSATAVALLGGDVPPSAELIDRGEHRLRDLDQPEHVFELVGPGPRREFPALQSMIGLQTNLPVELTSFVGRERELEELRELIGAGRLTTLVGVGGTGKTRLMLRAAADLVHRYRDGVWLVELAQIRDGDLVASEMTRALRILEQPRQPAIETVLDFIRSKELLLALDNCEHLLGSVSDVVHRLLGVSSRLTVVASSREPLGVGGERIFAVPSLALPAAIDLHADHGHVDPADLDRVAQAEATRLFVERAREHDPGFAIDSDNVGSLVEICRRLDGIPLAIELAAARMNVLTPSEIAERLGDRFRLLTGGQRTSVPRQQTLQALIDWSWDLLDDRDRRLLARLSVFAGSWTLEAAAAVAADSETDGDDRRMSTLDSLGRLVDRSLVVADHTVTTRYRMLEMIRQYAADRLVAAGEAIEVRTRHSTYFGRAVADASADLEGPGIIAALARLDAEVDNVRNALDWSFEADPESALRMCIARRQYLTARATHLDIEQLGRAVEVARALPQPAPSAKREHTILIARVLGVAAFGWAISGRGGGHPWAVEAVALARQTGDPLALSDALVGFTLTAVFGGSDNTVVTAATDELLELARSMGDWSRVSYVAAGKAFEATPTDPAAAAHWVGTAGEAAERSRNPLTLAFATLAQGRIASYTNQFDEAQSWFGQALAHYTDLGDRHGVLTAQSEIAHALRRAGAFAEARAAYRETIHGWQHYGNRGAIANQLENLAFVALATEDPARAARLLGAAEALRELSGTAMLKYERADYDAQVAQLRALLDPDALERGLADGRRMDAEEAVAYALSA